MTNDCAIKIWILLSIGFVALLPGLTNDDQLSAQTANSNLFARKQSLSKGGSARAFRVRIVLCSANKAQ